MTPGDDIRRAELRERLLRDFSPAERAFFLRKAGEAVLQKGYPAGEDLYQYCYYLTLCERMKGIDVRGGPGYMKFLYTEGLRDVENTARIYEERLELRKSPSPDPDAVALLEYLGEK